MKKGGENFQEGERKERGKKSRGKGEGRKEAARFAAAAAERNGGDSSIEVSVSVGRRSSDPGRGDPRRQQLLEIKTEEYLRRPPSMEGGDRGRSDLRALLFRLPDFLRT